MLYTLEHLQTPFLPLKIPHLPSASLIHCFQFFHETPNAFAPHPPWSIDRKKAVFLRWKKFTQYSTKTSTPKSMLHMFWIQIVTLNNKMYRWFYRIRYSQGSVGDFIGQDNVRILLSFYYKTNIFFHVIQPIKRNSFLIFNDAVL